jgi:hypothetical protein
MWRSIGFALGIVVARFAWRRRQPGDLLYRLRAAGF